MLKIAESEDEDLFVCGYNRIYLNYAPLHRPSGQKFDFTDENFLEHHSTLKATKNNKSTVQLELQVKNYGACFAKEKELKGTLFQDYKDQELKIALHGTKDDWEWAKKKFNDLLDRAELIGKDPPKKSNVIPGIIRNRRGDDGFESETDWLKKDED